MFSMTSDYREGTGWPEPYLRRIAEAGFSAVHWCHHWCTDFLYSTHEVMQVGRWLDELGLVMNDIHASAGREKNYLSAREWERLAGVELVVNRLRMAADVSCDTVILHVDTEAAQRSDERTNQSFDALCAAAEPLGVRIALENLVPDNRGVIDRLLDRYPAERIGICYDSGHGNLVAGALDWLDARKDRLLAVHLHDNDGSGDGHRPPTEGTVDWPRLAGILATSSYRKPLSSESTMGKEPEGADESAFLARVRAGLGRVAGLMDAQPA